MTSTSATQALTKLLADSYTLYLKTHNFHWNVTGPMFASLHTMFEQQYTELAVAVDDIAERIRALGDKAPGSYSEFAELTSIKESRGLSESVSAEEMVKQLAVDHVILSEQAKQVLDAANESDDDPTADLATQRMTLHQKTAWMLKSIVE